MQQHAAREGEIALAPFKLWHARWTATREELHAVSIERLGPRKSNECEIRFDTIVIMVPVAVCAASVSKLRSANCRIL